MTDLRGEVGRIVWFCFLGRYVEIIVLNSQKYKIISIMFKIIWEKLVYIK